MKQRRKAVDVKPGRVTGPVEPAVSKLPYWTVVVVVVGVLFVFLSNPKEPPPPLAAMGQVVAEFPPNMRNFTCTTPVSILRKRLVTQDMNMFLSCKEVSTPHSQYQQQCCEFITPGRVTCLPNLVVLGSQKAGTTALFSYLLLHPQVRTGPKKELHLYDFEKNYKVLFELLPLLLPSSPSFEHAATQVTADASPSYISDPKACFRMVRMLPKHARMVLLLRNPVDRTWSDFQMKHRRIALQDDFLFSVLPQHAQELKVCLVQCLNRATTCNNVFAFRDCLPQPLGRHGRLGTFFQWVKRTPNEGMIDFINHCLQGADSTVACFQSGGRYFDRILGEHMPSLPQAIYDEAKALNTTLRTCNKYEDCFPNTPMMSDVSANHLFRSLYFVQIQHCLSFIDRERLLIVNSDELLLEPKSTLKLILDHVGIDASPRILDELAAKSSKELHLAFQSKYPDFENISGWSKNAVHTGELKLPPHLRSYLNEFFRPWNRRLFNEILQVPSGWKGWAV
ncbi:hypothetical protein BASA81_006396 [Batrachochytrium salamandrivorans]|nr:hypothetical protein BASA81_006396 [Batrachochytrium salamandrivorans]